MNDLERTYVSIRQNLYAAAKEWADIRKAVIVTYVEQHHPGIQCDAKPFENNLLALEVVFPGLAEERSTKLANEINTYLESL